MKDTINKNYSVTEDGSVWSKRRGKFLKPQLSSNRYLVVGLGSHGTTLVHIIVATAYLGEKPEGYDVDHIDGNRQNNNLANLRFLPHRENSSRALLNKTGYTGVCWHNWSKKFSARIYVDGKRRSLGYFETPEEAQQAYQNALEYHKLKLSK